ncbi:MAG: F420-dependent methylenetetrahydromethanopterin dehydrogenase [Candidatus Bathyarchaeota archaeon]|jgi:methylenetetrahydromethanopterin dehydrogenase|nr:F420-dependent methylenetetrahydromethanopterin dehydrogenase [Candidatus Bathyarchaeota archaeon]
MVKVTFLKIGYIGTTNLIDALLDERASRKGISVRVVSSGCKMDDEEAVDAAKIAASVPSDLYVVVSPNAGLSGPTKAREELKETGTPIIVVSDEPSRKAAMKLPDEGIGYIVLYGDPMIGAKRDFLDPVEMAIFNSDVLRVLAVTGVFRLLHTELDRVIKQIADGEEPELPQIVVNKEKALEHSGLENPYARAKAMASFEAARRVAALDTEGCFRTEGKENYIPIITAAHELMRQAALMADEAREIEKVNDSVKRVVHFRSGELRSKTRLFSKFEK